MKSDGGKKERRNVMNVQKKEKETVKQKKKKKKKKGKGVGKVREKVIIKILSFAFLKKVKLLSCLLVGLLGFKSERRRGRGKRKKKNQKREK